MRKYKLDYSSKTEPFIHQAEAIDFIIKHKNIALFDEMGLGKTKIVLDALSNELKKGNIDSVLIVCKKTLICNWEDEINKHTNLPSITLRGSYKEKGMKFMGNSPFYIINYDSLITELKRIVMLAKIKKIAVVLDESHRIKDPNSKTAQSLFELAPLAKTKIIISGTPVANKPFDLWAQFYFLDGGKTLGTDYAAFKKEYSVDLKHNQFDVDKLSELKKAIELVSIRRLKKDVLELPNKTFQDVFVKLSGKQECMYSSLKDDLMLEISNMNDEEVIDEAQNILKRLLRLSQIASNPRLIDLKYNEDPVKFKKMDELVEKIIHKNEKVIIWSSFINNIIQLKKRYKKHSPVIIYGKITIDDRNKAAKKFINDPECKILIANPAAAREGLTLTVANNAIYLDRSFNLVDYIQSQDRIHRISQTKKCFIFDIIADNTVDKYIDEVIYKKQTIARFLQGDSNTLSFEKDFLTKEDIVKILGG